MKLFVAVFVIAFAVSALAIVSDSEWNSFKNTFHKNYSDPEEDAHRRAIYEKNLKSIEEHNEKYEKGEVTWKMGVNQFADWTHEEFKKWLVGQGYPKYQKNDSNDV